VSLIKQQKTSNNNNVGFSHLKVAVMNGVSREECGCARLVQRRKAGIRNNRSVAGPCTALWRPSQGRVQIASRAISQYI
jgi:hypothetical protein